MKKRLLAVLMTTILALSMFTACGGSGGSSEKEGSDSGDDYVVQIPFAGEMCSAPLNVADLKGFYEEEGVKYEIIKTGDDQFDAVAAGKADVIYTLLPNLIERMSNGFELQVVMGCHYGCLNMVAPADSDIKTVADLKGKKIGVPGLGTSPHVMLQRVLKAYDIGSTPDNMEVEILAFQDTDLVAAMEKGSIDAFMVWDPFATQCAREDGAKLLYEQAADESTKDEDCCYIGLRPDFVKEHPDVAAAYCRAIQKACDWIAENPEECAQLLVDNDLAGIDDVELTAELLASYRYKAEVQIAKDAFVKSTQDLIDLGIIEIDGSAEDFTNKAFGDGIKGFDCE